MSNKTVSNMQSQQLKHNSSASNSNCNKTALSTVYDQQKLNRICRDYVQGTCRRNYCRVSFQIY